MEYQYVYWIRINVPRRLYMAWNNNYSVTRLEINMHRMVIIENKLKDKS